MIHSFFQFVFLNFLQNGVDLIALRCAGFNNTDLEAT